MCVVISSYVHVVPQVVVEDVCEFRSLVCDILVVRVELALLLDVAVEVPYHEGQDMLTLQCRLRDGPKNTMRIIGAEVRVQVQLVDDQSAFLRVGHQLCDSSCHDRSHHQ